MSPWTLWALQAQVVLWAFLSKIAFENVPIQPEPHRPLPLRPRKTWAVNGFGICHANNNPRSSSKKSKPSYWPHIFCGACGALFSPRIPRFHSDIGATLQIGWRIISRIRMPSWPWLTPFLASGKNELSMRIETILPVKVVGTSKCELEKGETETLLASSFSSTLILPMHFFVIKWMRLLPLFHWLFFYCFFISLNKEAWRSRTTIQLTSFTAS